MNLKTSFAKCLTRYTLMESVLLHSSKFIPNPFCEILSQLLILYMTTKTCQFCSLLSGVPDYFYRNKISSGGDLSHYSSASLY